MNKKKTVRTVYGIAFFLQLAAEVFAAYVLYRLNMLPDKLMYAAVAGLVLLLCLTAGLMFIRSKCSKRHHKYVTTTGIIGLVLSVIITGCAVFGSYLAVRVNRTVEKVTTPPQVSDTIGVYVLANDPAQLIQDAKGYTFATTSAYDAENSQKTVEAIQEQLGTEIATKEYDSVFAMIDALYEEEVGAMILNEAYAGILTDVEDYADFDLKTRILYEYDITRPEPSKENEQEEQNEEKNEENSEAKPVQNIAVDPFVVYLSGSDTRNQMLATSRSDTNILMVVNPSTHEILLVNTPRDYYVPISVGGGAYDKLTHCGIYGIDCSMDTLSALYGIDINYYAQINFTGFEKLIDEIGGITVYSEQAWSNRGYDFVEGDNFMLGAKALVFARERYAFQSVDNQRGKNQMKVVSAVIDKATTSATLIQNYSGILESLEGMFATDIPSSDISELVKLQLSEGVHWDIHSYAVTGQGGNETTFSMPTTPSYVMFQNKELVQKGSDLMNRVLNGEKLSDADVAQ